MGGGQSVRSAEFQNHNEDEDMSSDPDDGPETHHISISNKMVERLVEDATITNKLNKSERHITQENPLPDLRDSILIEKLKYLDDSHSERTGLTAANVNATAKRIELRTANMMSVEPVCAEHANRILDCYNKTQAPDEVAKCWDTVGAFSRCVQETTTKRLHARRIKDAREQARKSRQLTHAREHALKDLDLTAPPPPEVPS